MSKIAFSNNLAKLKSYAKRGAEEAAVVSAMLDNIKVLAFTQDTEGDEGANIIRISAQVQDMDGSPIAAVSNILVTSVPIAGAGTMTAGTNGALIAGSATVQAWFQTDATGALDVDVLNAVAEDNLVSFQLDDGVVEQLVLTFA
jgi:hypothetical protein